MARLNETRIRQPTRGGVIGNGWAVLTSTAHEHHGHEAREDEVAARMLRPKYIVPTHYGTFPALTGTPDQLREELKKHRVAAEVVALRPGESLS